ncbi:hypothetical protein K2224_16800 [Streptomyces sp. BHT-5-2]|uniref:hypothetical protein n=1 Tax=Streptomyces sp. BHT-5-2 TaxID=2866715 RepID=UPI001C8E63E9|nr:hypothetical protein [Streptomyces sp. BHT-5-2]QZL04609.1 hypothetical protein K2224_16800 [Streptomyces sp. BHT-5-2]
MAEDADRPIAHHEVPLSQVRTRSADLAAMFEYFTTVGLDVDVAGLRRDYPEVGWHTFTDWAAGQDWPTLTAAIDAVLVESWATRPAPDRLSLTPDGRQRLARIAEHVDTFRTLSTAGISQDEYCTAVHVLERMTRNLETATDTTPTP